MSCPSQFVMSPNGSACIVKCPTTYTSKILDGVPSCVMMHPTKNEVLVSFGLTSVPPFTGTGTPGGPAFTSAYNDYTAALAVADARAGSANRESVAFSNLMTAENARGSTGGEEAYQAARVAYYTLTKGDSWIQEEKARIANTDAQPIVNSLASQYRSLTDRKDQQTRTIDVINGLKDKVLSVKDDLSFSVNTFQRQVDAIKNQINKDKKVRSETIEATTSWVDTFLNWVIAIATIVCIVMLVRRFTGGGPSLEKLRADTALFRAQTEYGRAKAGLPTQPSFLRQITGTV
jgi:hypothetical protein